LVNGSPVAPGDGAPLREERAASPCERPDALAGGLFLAHPHRPLIPIPPPSPALTGWAFCLERHVQKVRRFHAKHSKCFSQRMHNMDSNSHFVPQDLEHSAQTVKDRHVEQQKFVIFLLEGSELQGP
jgi:hypothetical protein